MDVLSNPSAICRAYQNDDGNFVLVTCWRRQILKIVLVLELELVLDR